MKINLDLLILSNKEHATDVELQKVMYSGLRVHLEHQEPI